MGLLQVNKAIKADHVDLIHQSNTYSGRGTIGRTIGDYVCIFNFIPPCFVLASTIIELWWVPLVGELLLKVHITWEKRKMGGGGGITLKSYRPRRQNKEAWNHRIWDLGAIKIKSRSVPPGGNERVYKSRSCEFNPSEETARSWRKVVSPSAFPLSLLEKQL